MMGPGAPSALSSAPPVMPGMACRSITFSPLSTIVTARPTRVISSDCHSPDFFAAFLIGDQESVDAADVVAIRLRAEVVFDLHLVTAAEINPAVASVGISKLDVELEIRELFLGQTRSLPGSAFTSTPSRTSQPFLAAGVPAASSRLNRGR